jgi:hypothetical protein
MAKIENLREKLALAAFEYIGLAYSKLYVF